MVLDLDWGFEMSHEYSDDCQCADCIDTRIDDEHSGNIERSNEDSRLAERRSKERSDRVRERRDSIHNEIKHEIDPTAPSVADLNKMFDLD